MATSGTTGVNRPVNVTEELTDDPSQYSASQNVGL